MSQSKQTICPICSGSQLSVFNPPNYSRCNGCAIVFQNPVPTEIELAKLYENYYQIVDLKKNTGYENYEENRSPAIFTKHYIPWIKKYADNTSGRFLDFGCGTGNLVLALKEAGYKDSDGCEFATDAFIPLRKKNITCFECKNIGQAQTKYSYVSMIDVVEHLREPIKDFEAIYQSLEKGGVVFIETINFDDIFVRYVHKEKWIGIAPAHTFLFGVTSLTKLLTLSGFTIVEVKSYRLSGSFIKWIIIKFLSIFIKSIRRKYKGILFQFTFGDGVRIVARKEK